MIDSPDILSTPPFETDDAIDFHNRSESFSNQVVETEDTLLLNSPLVEELSGTYVGNWNKLISQTNWEKGAVILRWREAMQAADLPKAACSDEAWARRVGNVTAQHVGRLRRVAERFGDVAKNYVKLYWSHFQAALDWDDAEMWLEGAVQNDWSVAQMRIQRWEAIGAPAELKPLPEDVFFGELDEDVNPRNDSNAVAGKTEAKTSEIGPADIVEGFNSDDSAFDVDNDVSDSAPKKSKNQDIVDGPSTGELLSGTLKDFSDMPEDLGDALESLKVAILNHKLGGWKDCPIPKLVKKLDALKELITSIEEN